jgi:DNA repair exonuclease SbcCD ATPase subunit
LVITADGVSQTGASRQAGAAAQPVHVDASEFVEPISLHLLRAEGARTAEPGYLQALELISGAAHTMASIEDQSQRIQAKALELTQRARSDRLEALQKIATLQEQLMESQTLVEQLDRRLAEAEERAATAEEWLQRFREAAISAFAARRKAGDLGEAA